MSEFETPSLLPTFPHPYFATRNIWFYIQIFKVDFSTWSNLVVRKLSSSRKHQQNRIHCYSLEAYGCSAASVLFISSEEYVIKERKMKICIYMCVVLLRNTSSWKKHF